MKKKVLNSVLVGCCAMLTGCVSFDFCKTDVDVCASGTSFLRPLSSVTATIPRNNDDGDIKVEIIYSKDQVSMQAATELVKAAKSDGG
ncbi:MAG: hypothetical protein AAGA95_10590 [Pseudomonadota bacterium]